MNKKSRELIKYFFSGLPVEVLKLTTPPIYRYKKKKPNNIHKVPIPSSGFESKVMLSSKVVIHKSYGTNGQEDCSYNNMKPVKSCGQKESCSINTIRNSER